MPSSLRIVIAQLNFKVGDLQGNLEKHLQATVKARDELNAQVIVFSESSLTGYPAEDLLLRTSFIQEANQALEKYMAEIRGIYAVVGHPFAEQGQLFNGCTLTYNGEIITRYAKQRLPNDGVFDERRYFTPGHSTPIFSLHGIPTSLVICEDLWKLDPVRAAAEKGAALILSPNASPFESDKHERRVALLSKRAKENHVSIVYANQIGGQDDLVFDGGSLAMNADGQLTHLAPFFKEALLPIDLAEKHSQPITIPSRIERIYQALVLSLRDYMGKNHFKGVLVGASGGIDSALTLAIAVDALGCDQVQAILMPSRYTATISLDDAHALASALNIKTQTIPIEAIHHATLQTLEPSFQGQAPDVTEENIQARIRGLILMALANKYHQLVLTTGNRSELAVGYCTLYGDMAGAFNVLKDIPKTLVYELARYRNSLSPVIPESSITREPTAELSPNQKDQDNLPPYEILDALLYGYLHEGLSAEDLIAQGFDPLIVHKTIKQIHQNEYKRRQSAIGPHIQHKSFGKDWRYPMTHAYRK